MTSIIGRPDVGTPSSRFQPLALRRNFGWSVAGTAVYMACQWAMLVVLARAGSPEVVGRFSLGLAITAPIMLLASLNLRTVQATDAAGRFTFGDYVSLRLLLTVVGMAAVALTAWLGGYRREVAAVIVTIGLSKSAEAVSDVLYGRFQQCGRLDWVARSMMLRGVLAVAGLAAAYSFTGSLLAGTSAVAVAWIGILLGHDAALARLTAEPDGRELRRPGTGPSRRSLLRLAVVALPMGLVTSLVSLQVNIPRYFLEAYCGPRELGIFAAIGYLVVAWQAAATALAAATITPLSTALDRRDAARCRTIVFKSLAFTTACAASGFVAAWAAGRPILALLYGPPYAEHQEAFLWLAGAGAMRLIAMPFYLVSLADRRYWRQFAVEALTTALLTWLSLALIRGGGTSDAARAAAGASLFHLSASVAVAWVVLRNFARRCAAGHR